MNPSAAPRTSNYEQDTVAVTNEQGNHRAGVRDIKHLSASTIQADIPFFCIPDSLWSACS